MNFAIKNTSFSYYLPLIFFNEAALPSKITLTALNGRSQRRFAWLDLSGESGEGIPGVKTPILGMHWRGFTRRGRA